MLLGSVSSLQAEVIGAVPAEHEVRKYTTESRSVAELLVLANRSAFTGRWNLWTTSRPLPPLASWQPTGGSMSLVPLPTLPVKLVVRPRETPMTERSMTLLAAQLVSAG